MSSRTEEKTPYGWVTLIGLVLLLLGVYGAVRTVVNLAVFPKYPTNSVYSIPFGSVPYYGPREEDCTTMPGPFLTDTSVKELNEEALEKEQEQSKQACLSGVVQAREQAKVNDISQSALFLFLGGGILISRKWLFS